MGKKTSVTLTARDRELFELLGRARWLSTTQIQRRFFSARSANAVNKRLRKLVDARFLRCVRPGMSSEQWYRLGSAVDMDAPIPSRLPVHLTHFSAINDIRLWFDDIRVGERRPVRQFLAEWELKTVGQSWPVTPDGIALVRAEQTAAVAVEVDCSTEHPRLLASKLRRYGAVGPDILAVLIVVMGWPRLRSVIKTLLEEDAPAGVRCVLADRERLLQASGESRAFVDLQALANPERPQFVCAAEFLACPVGLSCREESADAATASSGGIWQTGTVRV